MLSHCNKRCQRTMPGTATTSQVDVGDDIKSIVRLLPDLSCSTHKLRFRSVKRWMTRNLALLFTQLDHVNRARSNRWHVRLAFWLIRRALQEWWRSQLPGTLSSTLCSQIHRSCPQLDHIGQLVRSCFGHRTRSYRYIALIVPQCAVQ